MGDATEGHRVMTDGVFGFYGYYYMITGIHFMHVPGGMGVLTICFMKARCEAMGKNFTLWLESGATFWHMVDLLWVLLYPMFYLLRVI